MTNSSKRISRHNSRDEWTLTVGALVLPIASILSIAL